MSERTTPEAPQIQVLLRDMVRHRCVACAMEVSSHALAMRRVDGTRFAAAVFSNLTRDHLDYHQDMEHYFEAKRRLFGMLPPGAPSILNVDDPWGRRLAETVVYGFMTRRQMWYDGAARPPIPETCLVSTASRPPSYEF